MSCHMLCWRDLPEMKRSTASISRIPQMMKRKPPSFAFGRRADAFSFTSTASSVSSMSRSPRLMCATLAYFAPRRTGSALRLRYFWLRVRVVLAASQGGVVGRKGSAVVVRSAASGSFDCALRAPLRMTAYFPLRMMAYFPLRMTVAGDVVGSAGCGARLARYHARCPPKRPMKLRAKMGHPGSWRLTSRRFRGRRGGGWRCVRGGRRRRGGRGRSSAGRRRAGR